MIFQYTCVLFDMYFNNNILYFYPSSYKLITDTEIILHRLDQNNFSSICIWMFFLWDIKMIFDAWAVYILIILQMQPTTNHLSPALCHQPPVTCYLSPTTCHLLCVTNHPSPAISGKVLTYWISHIKSSFLLAIVWGPHTVLLKPQLHSFVLTSTTLIPFFG